MSSLTHKVEPGSTISLSDYAPRYDGEVKRKDAEAELETLTTELDELQELLYGAGTHSLLVVMQGMDTSGKDSTVRTVFGKVSPLGSYVAPFKVPTEEELAHDFLWRVHKVTPRKGQIGIFNRSHYEDVLVVRVHGYVPEKVWKARYQQINDFERLLADSGTIILKFFLNISREEQEERLREREQEIEKAWKLSAGDWRERELWDKYMVAYDDALGKCSTKHAPWHIVPADRKWFRNYAVASTIVETLRGYKDTWMEKLEKIGEGAKAELEAYRAGDGT
ncbi:polyphosphate kinase 2 family protein [Oscillochloris sp. ZM17-4]|uniref:PPK2 family polyphosphate kinase n=1 Tax=Oscillochloris sp. ZM17-4 TaxID=2866714 RepID=UPI001C73B39D|nr:PPK2 family polyphosphate kinase [Oscillochloris sp. ZM17-4]MBX0326932.1 polyphosphate kinase 2 family protein [Oscillochloris sp. ZM17-4]